MANDHGSGDGFGDGFGFGFGFGDGSGYGSGFGCGFGDGGGFGCGDGFGYGDGFGFGDGSGFGCGDGQVDGGIVIGRVGEFEVVHFAPWPYVRVGCEQHTIAYWRANWREIASEHAVFLDCDFDALLDSAEGRRHGA